MKLQAEFSVQDKQLPAAFGSFQDISDGGYERGYAQGEAAGYENGHTAGHAQGYAAGRQAEWSAFWDAYQDYGNRTNYTSAFGALNPVMYWTDEVFKPKYDIKPTTCDYMFTKCRITDLKSILETQGVVLDTSNATNIFRMFHTVNMTWIPALDLRKALNLSEMFSGTVESIEKLIFTDTGTQNMSGIFWGLRGLKEVRFEGVIGYPMEFRYMDSLSMESVQSVIDHLKDLSGEVTKTLQFHAAVGAKLTDAQKAAITAKNWTLVY